MSSLTIFLFVRLFPFPLTTPPLFFVFHTYLTRPFWILFHWSLNSILLSLPRSNTHRPLSSPVGSHIIHVSLVYSGTLSFTSPCHSRPLIIHILFVLHVTLVLPVPLVPLVPLSFTSLYPSRPFVVTSPCLSRPLVIHTPFSFNPHCH